MRGKVPPLESLDVDGNVLVIGTLGMEGTIPPLETIDVGVWVLLIHEVLMVLFIVYH
jgi:hypothetical protein